MYRERLDGIDVAKAMGMDLQLQGQLFINGMTVSTANEARDVVPPRSPPAETGGSRAQLHHVPGRQPTGSSLA